MGMTPYELEQMNRPTKKKGKSGRQQIRDLIGTGAAIGDPVGSIITRGLFDKKRNRQSSSEKRRTRTNLFQTARQQVESGDFTQATRSDLLSRIARAEGFSSDRSTYGQATSELSGFKQELAAAQEGTEKRFISRKRVEELQKLRRERPGTKGTSILASFGKSKGSLLSSIG